ncbi:ectonucleoside triphosphate diphosphohydrolase 5-like [Diadema antillarum]|uniref:ectonucleoside triphosphate diphosphohydrolase 5-like n=1 Tax=Diadema antillarum TaxID=105358 RepID=UPI003A8A0847
MTHAPTKRAITMQRLCCKVLVVSLILFVVSLLYLMNKKESSEVIVDQQYKPDEIDEDSIWNDNGILQQMPLSRDADFYGVMFDAGSTGSRVHVFHFQESAPGMPPILLNEVYNFTKLPLAKYADIPSEGANSLDILLKVALDSIPEHLWPLTPVALKATAGLRLLPEEKAEALLDAVHEHLKASPLHVERREISTTIMDGTDEGIFMWVTVNFLNGALTSQTPDTHGTLDMGGGSTQVTFLPQTQETVEHPVHRNFIKQHPFLKHGYDLYTKSYLGLGLKAARLEILRREKVEMFFLGSSDLEDSASGEFTSMCLPPLSSGSWEFGGNIYTVLSSREQSGHLYQNCLNVVKAFVEDMVTAPAEIHNQSFYALSYFWERAAEIGKVDWKTGGTLLVKDYRDAAINVCQDYRSYTDHPFHCMDMVYLSSVLSHGYHFSDDVQLIMTNNIKGFEVSWALGATLDLLRTHWENRRRL